MIETSKYKGKRLISQGSGKSFDQEIMHATLCGLEPDEGTEISRAELNAGCRVSIQRSGIPAGDAIMGVAPQNRHPIIA
jgi:hypothetical protein